MRVRRIMSLVACAALAVAGAAADVVPKPKAIETTGRVWTLPPAANACILVGPKAPEPVKYAAETLQRDLDARFGWKPAIEAGAAPAADRQAVIVLGTRAGLPALVKPPDDAVDTPDGYALFTSKTGTRVVAAVIGANARGVIYGQDTLRQLIRREGDALVLPQCTVRDWPTIPWRGEPTWRYSLFLEPGVLDGALRARLNYIDLRNDAMGLKLGSVGERERKDLAQIVKEAHRRGLFVYGTYRCGVKEAQVPTLLKAFERLIDLGCDGLWISYDDTGGGADPIPTIRAVVEMAKSHGISGHAIGYTPPRGARPIGTYHTLDSPHDVLLKAVPAMKRALYIITRPPSGREHQYAVQRGLTRWTWWHNWPRGFSGPSSDRPFVSHPLAVHLRHGKRPGPAYAGAPWMRHGWHLPNVEKMRDADAYIDGVHFWGVIPQIEYLQRTMGLWGWDPRTYDETRTRLATFRVIFGPSAAEPAADFENALLKVKALARRYRRRAKSVGLMRGDRSAAEALKSMQAALAAIERTAPAETLIDGKRLDSHYIQPMHAEVNTLEVFLGN